MVRNIHASGSWLIKDQSSTPHVIILPRISHSRFYATDKLYPLGIFIIAYIRNLIQVFRHYFYIDMIYFSFNKNYILDANLMDYFRYIG